METTSQPKVSVLLPNLNNRPFLEERFETIFNQTLADWELIVVDSYSDDGAWELIQAFAAKDERIRIAQAPRKGVYAGINHCISLARGEYIYIATSDDTMMPQCLEKMVEALDTHSECDICHCCLQVINENGEEFKNWWLKEEIATLAPQFYGKLMDEPHIRFAPYDGILYCALQSVYCSLTQLLIRRSVFDKVGLFPTNWGAIGDVVWEMQASLVCNAFHVPEALATWRIHPQQATTLKNYRDFSHWEARINIIKAALPILEKYNTKYADQLQLNRLLFVYRRQQLKFGREERTNPVKKLLFTLKYLWLRPDFAALLIPRQLFHQPEQSEQDDDLIYIREELERLGLNQLVKAMP